jgi:hypothetical protein
LSAILFLPPLSDQLLHLARLSDFKRMQDAAAEQQPRRVPPRRARPAGSTTASSYQQQDIINPIYVITGAASDMSPASEPEPDTSFSRRYRAIGHAEMQQDPFSAMMASPSPPFFEDASAAEEEHAAAVPFRRRQQQQQQRGPESSTMDHNTSNCVFCIYENMEMNQECLPAYSAMLTTLQQYAGHMDSEKLASILHTFYYESLRPVLKKHVPQAWQSTLCPRMSVRDIQAHIQKCTNDPIIFQSLFVAIMRRVTLRLANIVEKNVQRVEEYVLSRQSVIMNDSGMDFGGGNEDMMTAAAPGPDIDRANAMLLLKYANEVRSLYRWDASKSAFHRPVAQQLLTSEKLSGAVTALGIAPNFELAPAQPMLHHNNDAGDWSISDADGGGGGGLS